MTWQLTITGLLIGALVGLTGMGGGSLLTPMLILFFGFQPTLAVGTDILHGAVFKTFVKRGVQPSDAPFLLANRDRVICFALGASGGFIVGLTSVGSGTFFGLVMLLVFPLTAAKIVGTDIFHAAALLWVAGISHLVHGNVDLGAMGWLLLGSIPGVLFASKLTVRVPEGALRVGLGTVLLASGVRLIELPGYGVLVPVILVLGAIGAGLTEFKRLNARAVAEA